MIIWLYVAVREWAEELCRDGTSTVNLRDSGHLWDRRHGFHDHHGLGACKCGYTQLWTLDVTVAQKQYPQ